MIDDVQSEASGNQPVIRRFGPDDYRRWLPLWQAYQQFYNTQIPDETTEVVWQRLLDSREPMWGALAMQGDRALGFVHWIYHRSCWTVGDYCYLQDLLVASEARGQGLGRSLIARVEQEARATGCSRVYWLTQESNAQARILYDRVAANSGFIQYRKIF